MLDNDFILFTDGLFENVYKTDTTPYEIHEDKIEIKFEVNISKNSIKNLLISYRNLQSGISQVNMKYWYHISLYNNPNKKPFNISFIYKTSENSELYISDLYIENKNNKKMDLEIERSCEKNTLWYTKMKDYITSYTQKLWIG